MPLRFTIPAGLLFADVAALAMSLLGPIPRWLAALAVVMPVVVLSLPTHESVYLEKDAVVVRSWRRELRYPWAHSVEASWFEADRRPGSASGPIVRVASGVITGLGPDEAVQIARLSVKPAVGGWRKQWERAAREHGIEFTAGLDGGFLLPGWRLAGRRRDRRALGSRVR